MANLTPTPGWDNVFQLETDTPVLGGAGGVANSQAQALLNRTAFLEGPTGSSKVGHTPAGTGAVVTTVGGKLQESVSVKDFGATGDGVTDDRPSIQAALDYLASIGGGRLYFPPCSSTYLIASEHPTFTGHGLVVQAGIGSGDIVIEGCGLRSIVTLGVGAPITSLMYWPNRLDRMVINKMWFDAASLANNVFKADQEYHPYLTLRDSEFRRGLTSCISVSTFVAEFTRVQTFRGQYGFSIKGIGSGPVTSVTLTACYALQPSIWGFDCGYLTYCTFNSCACDGDAGGAFHTQIAYSFVNAYGVTMNSCGSEQVQRFLKVGAFRGMTINSPFMLSAGGESLPVDYLFEFVSGTNATIGGIRIETQRPGGFTYIIGQTGSSFGSENVTVTDNSANRNQVFQVTNFAFGTKSVKLLRGDETNKSETVAIANTAELIAYINSRTYFKIDHDIILQLADGTYSLGGTPTILQSLTGSGRITIQGNASNRALVQIDSNSNRLQVVNSRPLVIFKDLTITGTVSNTTIDRLRVNNALVSLVNVSILRNGINVGSGVSATNGSKVFFDALSLVEAGTWASGSFEKDNSSEFVFAPRNAAPATGAWVQGNIIYDDTPTAGGYIGFVCVATGSPGTWKDWGAILP